MSVSLVDSIIKGTILALDGCEVLLSAAELHRATAMEKITLISKMANTALSAWNFGAEMSGSSLKVQKALNVTQIFTGFVLTAMEFEAGVERLTIDPNPNVVLFFEKVFGTILQTLRVGYQARALAEKEFLAMTDEERATATRPVYEGSGDDEVLVGYKPVDKAECEQFLKEYTEATHNVQIIECITKTHIVLQTSGIGDQVVAQGKKIALETVKKLVEFTTTFRQSWKLTTGQERVNLLERKTIPSLCYEDSVLSKYICPLTRTPMRHPVEDPETHVLYERDAVNSYIDLHGTSPTGTVLRKEDLLPSRDIQQQIDDRLKEIQEDINLLDLEIAALARKEN
jgi:hypothetical protein